MAAKTKLSKGILEMKFMKRTKEKVEKESEAAEGRAMYSSEITEKMKGSSNFIIEPSYFYCEDLIEGRLSFRGMNPEIERILELEEAAKQKELQPQQTIKKEVDDEEMAKYYGNVVQTIAKKFDSHKKRRFAEGGLSNKRRKKFIKPREDD